VARYSREQRRCAVELYERYEHSAADVIRELGYPSKEALLMWYREWLEERRTGVPSRRGERYARYTDEQKRRAVDTIEECGGSVTRAMRRLGYPTRHKSSATFSFGKRS
jgi:transposase-like protein